MLFENEVFNITKIKGVTCYKPRKYNKFSYPGKLPTYELMYYEEGESTVYFGGKAYNMAPDNILYLPKGIENNEYTLKMHKPLTLYNIYFETEDKLPDTPVKISVKSSELKSLFQKLYRTWFAKKDGYYYKSARYTYNIIELIRKQQSGYNTQNKFSYLTPCEDYISSHYCDLKFNYAKLTSLSGLSYSYFKKLFIDKYGMPPVKYINRLKINRACELLITEKFRINEIAELCGFENTYYFSNCFKKHTGVSPIKYTKNQKK